VSKHSSWLHFQAYLRQTAIYSRLATVAADVRIAWPKLRASKPWRFTNPYKVQSRHHFVLSCKCNASSTDFSLSKWTADDNRGGQTRGSWLILPPTFNDGREAEWTCCSQILGNPSAIREWSTAEIIQFLLELHIRMKADCLDETCRRKRATNIIFSLIFLRHFTGIFSLVPNNLLRSLFDR